MKHDESAQCFCFLLLHWSQALGVVHTLAGSPEGLQRYSFLSVSAVGPATAVGLPSCKEGGVCLCVYVLKGRERK